MRAPPALLAFALLAGCLAPAGFAASEYSLSGVFTVLALPLDIDEVRGLVVREGGNFQLASELPPSFEATELTSQGCRLVYEFALTRVYLDIEGLGTCAPSVAPPDA